MCFRNDGVLRAGTRHIGVREVRRLARGSGVLRVLAGRLWITRKGDETDYFLCPGETFAHAEGECVVIESALAEPGTIVFWRPDPLPWHARLAREIARLLAGPPTLVKETR